MKIYIVFFALFSSYVYAQYLGAELSESDLDPNKQLVKEVGTPPKEAIQLSVDESRRKEKEIKRGPAVVIEVEKSSVSK